jgi:hypothetical protein
MRLLTPNLAVLAASGKLHDVIFGEIIRSPNLIGSSAWLVLICKSHIQSEDVKKPKEKFALATWVEDIEI